MKRTLAALFAFSMFIAASPAYATVCNAGPGVHHGLGTVGFLAASIPAYFAPSGRTALGVGLGFEEAPMAVGATSDSSYRSGLATPGFTTGDWDGLGYDVHHRSRTVGSCGDGRTHTSLTLSWGWTSPAETIGVRFGAGPQYGFDSDFLIGLGSFARFTANLPILLLDLELSAHGNLDEGDLLVSLIPLARATVDVPFPVKPFAQADYEFPFAEEDSERDQTNNFTLTLGAGFYW